MLSEFVSQDQCTAQSMAAALDSSYIPKEIKDVPVDPAAASRSTLPFTPKLHARSFGAECFAVDASVQKSAGAKFSQDSQIGLLRAVHTASSD